MSSAVDLVAMMRDAGAMAALTGATPKHVAEKTARSHDRLVDTAVALGGSVDDVEAPDWVALQIADAILRVKEDGCSHLVGHDPEVVFMAAWAPGKSACLPCSPTLMLQPGSDADKTCDRCGFVTPGGIYTNSVVMGRVLFMFGLCGDCQAEERERTDA